MNIPLTVELANIYHSAYCYRWKNLGTFHSSTVPLRSNKQIFASGHFRTVSHKINRKSRIYAGPIVNSGDFQLQFKICAKKKLWAERKGEWWNNWKFDEHKKWIFASTTLQLCTMNFINSRQNIPNLCWKYCHLHCAIAIDVIVVLFKLFFAYPPAQHRNARNKGRIFIFLLFAFFSELFGCEYLHYVLRNDNWTHFSSDSSIRVEIARRSNIQTSLILFLLIEVTIVIKYLM